MRQDARDRKQEEKMIRSYEDLEVYKISYRLALEIHRISLILPEFERYELGSQLRRATKSIPLNIAEGYGKRSSSKEFKRYLAMAIGSCDEIKVILRFMMDLGYIDSKEYQEQKESYDIVGKMLYKLYKNWQ